jgi:hypothetical protein
VALADALLDTGHGGRSSLLERRIGTCWTLSIQCSDTPERKAPDDQRSARRRGWGEVRGIEPLASSVGERTGMVGRPVMLADKGS